MSSEPKPIELTPHLKDMVELGAASLFSLAVQQAHQLVYQASDLAQHKMIEDIGAVPKARKIQVVQILCEDGIIDVALRDRILDQLQSVG